MSGRDAPPVDYDTLADLLRALSYPLRLELLSTLRLPHTLGDIRLAPRRTAPGENPDRPATRQTILAHLETLVEADFVRSEEEASEGRVLKSYTVNPLRLYTVTEELRRLSIIYAGLGPAGDATGTVATAKPPRRAEGTRLVLVHGVYESKAFPLDATTGADGRWTIGRKRGLAVSLDYDPYVSVENSIVDARGSSFVLKDLDGSKNGTSVNWSPLEKGETHELRSGDIIGVGRSLLCFVDQ